MTKKRRVKSSAPLLSRCSKNKLDENDFINAITKWNGSFVFIDDDDALRIFNEQSHSCTKIFDRVGAVCAWGSHFAVGTETGDIHIIGPDTKIIRTISVSKKEINRMIEWKGALVSLSRDVIKIWDTLGNCLAVIDNSVSEFGVGALLVWQDKLVYAIDDLVKIVEFGDVYSHHREVYKAQVEVGCLAIWNETLAIAVDDNRIVRIDKDWKLTGIMIACDLTAMSMCGLNGFLFFHAHNVEDGDESIYVWNEDGLLVQTIGELSLTLYRDSIITSFGNIFSVWKTNPWSTELHRKFPVKVRKAIGAMMLLKSNTRTLISTLPRDILYFVFSLLYPLN
jgi:hypothetical protein